MIQIIKCCIVLYIFLGSLNLIAQQNTLFKIFYTNDDSWGCNIKQTNNNGFIIVGNGSTSKPGILIKTNENGNISWMRTYSFGLSTVKQTLDGGYIATGGICINGHCPTLCFFKTNEIGDTIWTRIVYGLGGQNSGKDVIQTSDGKYMITGGVLMAGVNITKVDTNGTNLWTNFYGITSDDGGKKIIETTDKGFVVLGSSMWSLMTNIFIFKIDSIGNEVWKRYVGDIVPALANDMIQTFDGGYIITGWKPNSIGNDSQIYILKTNSDGWTQWTKTYGNPDSAANSNSNSNESGMSIVQCADSSFMLLYNRLDSSQVYLMKLSSTGDSLWSKKVLDSGDGRALIKTNDNGFAITGYVYYNNNNVDAFLLKTDSLGNYVNSVSFLFADNKEKAILFPNPFTIYATLYLNKEPRNAELIIYNLLGSIEKRILNIQSKVIIINREGLPDGMYLYELRENGFVFVAGKFVVGTN